MKGLLFGALVLGGLAVVAAGSNRGRVRPFRIPASGDPAQRFADLDPPRRLEALLTTWMALADDIVATHGTAGELWTPELRIAPKALLANIRDIWSKKHSAPGSAIPVEPHTADDAKALWNKDPSAVIAQAEDMLRRAVEAAAYLETQRGRGVFTPAGDEVSLLDLAEEYATEAAMNYLTTSIPGAGSVLALGSLLGGPGWDYGRTTPVHMSPEQYSSELLAARETVYRRALDLIRHAMPDA